MLALRYWGGILGGLIAGSAIHYLSAIQLSHLACSTSLQINPVFSLPIGIGEESYYRGFLQSDLSDSFNPTVGIIGSSILFGAAHIPNAAFLSSEDRFRYYAYSIPFITLLGSYFGWLTKKNHSLQESVAVHTWYDFIVFLAQVTASSASIEKTPTFHMSFAF